METPISFSDFPHDIQLNILSFLEPVDISSLSLTSRHFSSLCNPSSAPLWLAVCHRRWGAKTNILSWSAAPSHRLYKTLDQFETLIGFWFLTDHNDKAFPNPTLVLFEWHSFAITGFCVFPSPAAASHSVLKWPFMSVSCSDAGDPFSWMIHDFVPVTATFSRRDKLYVEEGLTELVIPERFRAFANIVHERKRKRKRKGKGKGKERVVRKRLMPYSLFRISNCFPTPARPLQGLWKVMMWLKVIVFCLFDKLLV